MVKGFTVIVTCVSSSFAMSLIGESVVEGLLGKGFGHELGSPVAIQVPGQINFAAASVCRSPDSQASR